MTKKNSPFSENLFQFISLATIILILVLHGCKPGKTGNSFILDDIQYDLKDGGVGYNVNNDNTPDLNEHSFIAMLHITNPTNKTITLDSSKFKLTGDNGISFSLMTRMSDIDVSSMYKQKIEPGESIDYLLTFAIPAEGHYNLHVISPISGTEKIIEY